MDTRKIAREYRLTSWAQLAHERSESGLSVRDFCLNRGIKENTYYYWQRKLREAVTQELSSPEPKQLAAPIGWAAVAESNAPAPSATLTMEVGAFHIAVNSNTDMELLRKVCQTLVSVC